MTEQSSLADRYGTPSRGRATFTKAAVVIVAVMFLGWIAWGFLGSAPDARFGTVGYDVVDDHRIDVTAEVRLSDADSAECLVRAMSADKATVGELSFTAREGQQEVTVRTERRASTAEVVNCRVPE